MGTSTNFVTYTNNIIRLHPYMPHSTFTTSSLAVQILTGQTGAAIRLLIYNNSATKPSGKLFESTSISCATSGLKTVSTSFTFTAGTIYWLGFQNSLSGTSATIASLTSANLIPFLGDASSNSAYIGYETSAYSYGSAPTTMGAVTAVDSNFPLYWITIA